MQTTKPHAVMLASPGMGHLIPVIELGKRLVTNHNFQATVFVVAIDASSEKLSQLINSSSTQDCLDINILPYVDISTILPHDASLVTQIAVMMHESLPALRSSISAMKSRPTALVVDLFGLQAMSVADEFDMSKFVFIASNAWFLAVTLFAPSLDKKAFTDHVYQKQPLKIPGCSSVRFEDTLEPFQDPNGPMCVGFSQLGIHMLTADGILVNAWEDLESKTLTALRDPNKLGLVVGKVPVYPIGPLARPAAPTLSISKVVLDWLDNQPNESVIYVSFGSGGTLSSKQMMELAWGLELSMQRFIWVVRPPFDGDLFDSYLTAGNVLAGGDMDYLPEGFLSRTDNVGLVVPMWAPQAEILAHPSVGGFLTHCGWNSTLESIVNGVPMIAWPLYAEQKMNATMLTEEIGVAVRSKEMPSECMVEREEIEMLVRRIMVDKEVRNKVEELKIKAQKTWSEGGCSYNSLSKFANDCENSLQRLKGKAQGG